MVVESSNKCPACGADWSHGQTCEEQFHALLFLEHANPALAYPAHHLLVMCYMLQHNQYSEQARAEVIGMLRDALEFGANVEAFREKNKRRFSQEQRTFRITGSAGSDQNIDWPLTVMDIDNQDAAAYVGHVTEWARSVLAMIKDHGTQ